MSELQLRGDRVLIRPVWNHETTTKSGIVVPPVAHKEEPQVGVIEQVGQGRWNSALDSYDDHQVAVGDSVLYQRYIGDSMALDAAEPFKKTHIIISESHIIAVLPEGTTTVQ